MREQEEKQNQDYPQDEPAGDNGHEKESDDSNGKWSFLPFFYLFM